jgi:hypothetical protein
VTGWDKPVDPRGDCKFKRDGDRLTITVPGGGHELDAGAGRLNAPRLLRDVEGNFVAVVRVGGGSRSDDRQGAGMLLTDGTGYVRLERVAAPSAWDKEWWRLYFGQRGLGEPGQSGTWMVGPDVDEPAYLRLSRRGARVWGEYSLDAKGWWEVDTLRGVKLPRNFQVGVFAESAAPGTFQVWFDRFTLTRPKK